MNSIKSIQSRVSLYCSSKETITPIDFAAEVLCELLGIENGINKADDALSYPELVDLVLQILSVSKKHNYSKEGTLQMIKHLFIGEMNLEQLKSLIKGSMIVTYPDSLDGDMQFSYISQNPPQLRKISGDEDYVPLVVPEKKTRTIKTSKKIETQIIPLNPRIDTFLSKDIIALKSHYNCLIKEGKRYFWEWKINTDQYKMLKALLTSIRFKIQRPEIIRECAPQIALYIAEWYKREYDGYNSSNCLEEIGLDSSKSQMIWENANLRQDDVFCTDVTKIHEWLYSMYLLGGFPIRYTNRSNRFSSMFDAIWGEDKENDIISDEQLSDITQSFDGSKVIKNSLMSGSLHDYYRYLRVREDMPIADEDKAIEPFKTFIKNLQEGRNRFFRNYIRANWYFYIDPSDNKIDCTFRVTFGRKGDKCYIPSECLEFWNIPHTSEVKDFWIALEDKKFGLCEKIRFSKTGSGDRPYVGWTRKNSIEIDIPYSKDVNIEVNLCIGDAVYPIHDAFKVEDSHQFYKTDNQYEWSDRTDNHSLTAIIYNPLILSSDKPSLMGKEKVSDGDDLEWIWLPLSEEIILSNGNGETIKYTPHNHQLTLSFKQIKSTLKYVNFRDVIYRQIVDGDAVDNNVPLLKKDGLSVSFTPYGSSEPEKIPLSKCRVFFKQEGDEEYIPWENSSSPKQGIVKIHVTYPEKSISTSATAFYLTSATPIKRDVDTGTIKFSNLISSIFAPTADGYVKLEPVDGAIVYHDDLNNGYDLQSDIIPFLIGDPTSSYALLNVLRARKCKELYLKGEPTPIARYSGETDQINIPFILKDNFSIRTIDEVGVRSTKCGNNIYLHFSNQGRYDRDNKINYYCTKEHNTRRRGDIQLETCPDQYRFYYWSVRPDESPIPISYSFDSASKILSLDLTPLKNNEKGMVFQSLRGVTPRHYFAPIYGKSYALGQFKYRQECFDIAAYHRIPFQLFHCLKKLFEYSSLGFLMDFMKEYMRKKSWSISQSDIKTLHRFAEEFCFDWILIPRSRWYGIMTSKDDKQNQDTIKGLFRASPHIKIREIEYLERVIDLYWKLPTRDQWGIRRSSSTSNIAIQCMRGWRDDFDMNSKPETINKLEAIHASERLYEEIYKTFALITTKK